MTPSSMIHDWVCSYKREGTDSTERLQITPAPFRIQRSIGTCRKNRAYHAFLKYSDVFEFMKNAYDEKAYPGPML